VASFLVCVSAIVGVVAENDNPAKADGLVTKTVKLSPSADTYVSQGAPNKVYGGSARLSATSQAGGEKTAFLRFAIPPALFGSITKAELVLTRDEHHYTGPVSLHTMANPSWGEATTTARNAPSYDAASATVNTTAASYQTEFNVTAASRAYPNPSFALTSASTTDVARFRSREAPSGGPRLVLTVAVSVPTGTGSVTPSPSSASTTPVPTSKPTSSASGSPSATPTPTTPSTTPTTKVSGSGGFNRPTCAISAKLVPSCGRWWGMSPRRFTSLSLTVGLAQDESLSRRPMDIVHDYHVNGALFPNAAERALALQPGSNRLLFLNWKPATDMTWRDVANGKADSRIDAEASYLKSNFNYPFFLTIWHEPENDVNATAGSGKTAVDYAAMFHHVVSRLRADGATKFVSVMDYMGYVPWAQKSWFSQLWPGNDVVDWLGIDPYGTADASGYNSGDFNTLVNRTAAGFPGFYNWAVQVHPGIPIMVAEWGIGERSSNPTGKAMYFDSVAAEIARYAQIKALVYFDATWCPGADFGDTSPDSSATSLAAWQKLGYDSDFIGPAFHYVTGAVASGG
jgi:hypothetical protein